MGKAFGKRNPGLDSDSRWDSNPRVSFNQRNSRFLLSSVVVVAIAAVGFAMLGSNRSSMRDNQSPSTTKSYLQTLPQKATRKRT